MTQAQVVSLRSYLSKTSGETNPRIKNQTPSTLIKSVDFSLFVFSIQSIQ